MTARKQLGFLLVTPILGAMTLGAMAQTSTPAMDTAAPATTPVMQSAEQMKDALRANMDRLFLARAFDSNAGEVTLSQLALSHSSNAEVRRLANMLINEHGATNVDLMRVLTGEGITPPAPGLTNKALEQHLARLSGADFDKAYMAAQVEAHENAVLLFQQELAVGSDADARAYAERTLPKILAHTATIYDLARQIGAPGISDRPAPLIDAAAAADTMSKMPMPMNN